MIKKVVKEVLSIILLVISVAALARLLTSVLFLRVQVPSGSMEQTIIIDNKVVAYRYAYQFGKPERGDIVVFPYPDNEKVNYIKRIIGLPGETIEGRDGYIYLNGKLLKESYVTELLDSDFGPCEIPEGSYFMMGDNRNHSEDSRDWDHKYVAGNKIKGKAVFTYPDFKWLY